MLLVYPLSLFLTHHRNLQVIAGARLISGQLNQRVVEAYNEKILCSLF